MKLYEFKTKYMTQLALLKTTNEREKQLRQMLIVKLENLRTMNMPNLVFTLYQIMEYENVSDDFKNICRSMLEDIEKIETE